MLFSKKGSVFVYTLVLVTLSVSMAMIVVTNVSILNNTFDQTQLANTLESGLKYQATFMKDRTDFFNSDGDGFNDNFGCPQNIVMSGSTNRSTNITSDYYATGSIISCRADFNGENLDLIFSNDYSTFDFAELSNANQVSLNGQYSKTGDSTFSDSDNTLITFNSSYFNPDGVDDNFNSDNFSAQNSDTTLYSSGILDNDANAKIYGVSVIPNDSIWKNIFWNNIKISDYINENTNNNVEQTPNLSNSSGSLFLENSVVGELRITEFRKADFDLYGDLVPINKNEFVYTSTGSGFLQTDGTLSNTITGNEFEFNFVEKNYAIFYKNTHSDVGTINFHFETSDNKKIIIFPIKDDIVNVFSYLSYKIIINSSGRYIYKLQEIFTSK